MTGTKYIRPPLVWQNQKTGLAEDARYRRWTPEQLRAMRNGTYDWSKHKEIPIYSN